MDTIKQNLERFQGWLNKHAIERAIKGFLPTFIDGDSRDYYLTVNTDLQPRTDGRRIYISLIPPVLQDDYGTADWLVLLRAITAHEAQHTNSSNFADIKEIGDWYGKYLKDNFEIEESIGAEIAREFLNKIEDGRIESIAVKRRPGMLVPFIFLNEIIRNGTAIEEKASDVKTEYAHFANQVLSYAKTGLYAPGIQVYEDTELEKNFLAIRNLIDEGVNAITSADCKMAVMDLLMEISPYLVSLMEQSEELQQELAENDKNFQPEYTSNNENEFNGEQQQQTQDDNKKNSSAVNPLRRIIAGGSSDKKNDDGKQNGNDSADTSEKSNNNTSNSCSSNFDSKSNLPENSDTASDNTNNGNNTQENDVNDNSEQTHDKSQEGNSNSSSSEDINYGFGNVDNSGSLTNISEDKLNTIKSLLIAEITRADKEEHKSIAAKSQLSDKDIEGIKQSYQGHTKEINISYLELCHNNPLPMELQIQAITLRREVMRIIQSKQSQQKYMARGLLDTKSLWQSEMSDRLFYRKRNPDNGSAAFYLLIDNSGSMDASAYQDKSGNDVKKYEAARGAAAIIESAVQGLVPCKIALFDYDSIIGKSANHIVIKDFERNDTINHSWNSLMEIGSGCCNADSVNIRIATKELLNRREKRKFLFLLSDGQPSAYSDKMSAQVEVMEAVKDARRKGCIVIPIMFGNEDFQRIYAKDYKAMYEKHIISCLPQEITFQLCRLFKILLKS